MRLLYLILIAVLIVSGCSENESERLVPPSQPQYYTIESELFNVSHESGEGILKVSFTMNELNFRENVLMYTLSRLDIDRNTVIDEKELFKGTLKVDDKQSFTVTLGPLKKGRYMIDLQALSAFSQVGDRWGALRTIAFEMQNNKIYIFNEHNVNE